MRIEKHKENLRKHYRDMGLSETSIERIVAEKSQKLFPKQSQEDYSHWLAGVLPEIARRLGKKSPNFLDLGCGTGELCLLANSLGFLCRGHDVYEKEIQIARDLLVDNGLDPDKLSCSQKITELESTDCVLTFSVVEHLSEKIFRQILGDCREAEVGAFFILVPNRYKIIDDHTGLPFLGILPRAIAVALVKLSGRKYQLSESGSWDVWYRSPRTSERTLNAFGYRLAPAFPQQLFPPEHLVSKIGTASASTFAGQVVNKLYRILLRLVVAHPMNDHPYLNLLFLNSKYFDEIAGEN